MRSKTLLFIIAIFVAALLAASLFSAGFVTARLLPAAGGMPFALTAGDETFEAQGNAAPADMKSLFVAFWQAWDLVHKQYVEQPVDDAALMRGAIRGMLDSLGDPHTSYLDPEEYGTLNTALQGEDNYEGIGAWVDPSGDYLSIISPMPGSPAEKAGLRTGDLVIGVDGEDVTGIDGEVVRKRIIGPAGTQVRLTILREGQEPFDVTLTRASINVPTVEGRMLENDIAYVRISIFADDTKDELRRTLEELLDLKPKGLVLDLRGNGGGYLIAAIDVASEFLSRGVIVHEEYGDGTRQTYEARRGGLATKIPMAVLINEGSASASEIVAGALQDHERALLIGMQSFGKGSVQLPTPLKDDQGAVRITIARWLTPDERTIHEVGLTPDVEVTITPEDFEAGRDPQLDKAVEILLGQ
ncbi:MAG: S41 family peptidase [Chloroflexi bacterium]|nr:S41 family peptidase [Chloroflexota bacterium]